MASIGTSIAKSIVGFYIEIWGKLELWFIVYPIEALRRLYYLLDPRVHSEHLRIRRITEGGSRSKGDRYIVFVLYTQHSVPPFIRTVIEAIGRSRLNLVISTNANISQALRESLLAKCLLLIERADLGRDFGGYRDGISIIEKRFGVPERLILLNDSLFFFENGVHDLINAL